MDKKTLLQDGDVQKDDGELIFDPFNECNDLCGRIILIPLLTERILTILLKKLSP